MRTTENINKNIDIINISVYNTNGGDLMRIDEQIKMLCLKSGMSMAEMARRLNKTPQAFNQKIKRGNFTIEELTDIATVSGCEFKCEFLLLNGEKIIIE